MPLWLYALTTAPLPEGSGRGAAGEPLTAWPIVAGEQAPAPPSGGAAPGGRLAGTRSAAAAGGGGHGAPGDDTLYVVAGEVPAPLGAEEATLRAHERTVRTLAAALDPLLPVRFGQTVATPGDLPSLLAPRRPALLAALARVAGCQQITLRFPAPAGPRAEGTEERSSADPERGRCEDAGSTGAAAAAPGPGTRYLRARHDAAAAAAAPPPDARPLLARLAPHVRAERLAPARPPYAATVYHLVERPRLDAYLATLAEAAADSEAPPVSSGPWPAWAFAPGLADGDVLRRKR